MKNLDFFIDQVAKDKLLVYALPLFISVIIVEYYWAKKHDHDVFDKADSKASVWMMIITLITEIVPKLLAFIAFYYLHEISPLQDIIGRQWWAWVLLFVLDDFTYYWLHRSNHEVRLFWAGHVPHHSAIKMNFTVALRQGVGERIHKFFFWLWLPILGFDPMMIFIVMSINLFYQFWVHTEAVTQLPNWVEYIFNTPSHHRVHHASNARYLDRNHAGVFILWDRWFGTFSQELAKEKPVYGLTKNLETTAPLHVASHEYVAIWKDVLRANNWKDKLKYIFYAPGWSHDGPDLRAKTLRALVKE